MSESPRPPRRAGELADWMTLLAEPTRGRLLRVLEREELGVGELTRIVQLPQSTVSRHLKTLHTAGWLRRRSVGTSTRVTMDRDALAPSALVLWQLVSEDPACARQSQSDRVRLASVIAARQADSRTFFGRVAAGWDELRDSLFGRSYVAAGLLGLVPRDWHVVDLGCGTGEMLATIAPHVAQVTGVDGEPSMLAAANARLPHSDTVRWVQGELTALPLQDSSADAVLSVLVMHHLPEPALALSEARRILRPGGRLVWVDMVAHDRESYREEMGHQHLGFDADRVRALAQEAGFVVDNHALLPADVDAHGPPLFQAILRRESVRARSLKSPAGVIERNN